MRQTTFVALFYYQVYEVRLTEEQPKSQYMTMAQRSQNKMLRILDGALVSERKSTKTLLDNQNMLSVNQQPETTWEFKVFGG